MVIFKCKMCGGNLEVSEGSSVATCAYCGTEQTLPTSNDEGIVNLFNRANYLRLKCEFDKASETYEKILDLDNSQAEAHWGIVLCKYGIEYVDAGVDEDLFGSKKPTCHRTQLESILTDADYLEVLQNADTVSQPIYKAEAKRINEIQKKILEVVKNEKPFDVFICYKERDENNQKTRDSVIANEIYHELTDAGLKVFYAAITLEDKLGEEYEPYIYAALSSAKVMLALGTRLEYFNAVWVKNEWSRYLHMMKTDKSKRRTLIPCYRDMDAYDLPDEFSHLQALDMSGIAFIPDLIRNIKKLTGNVQQPETTSQHESSNSAKDQALPLLKRAFLFLEDGDFQRADEMLEKALNRDPENAKAYIGKLMIGRQVRSDEELVNSKGNGVLLRDEEYFKKANRFADEEYKKVLEQYNNQNLEMWYNVALKTVDAGEYVTAKSLFLKISDYKDSKELVEKCSSLETERIYNLAKNLMSNGDFVNAQKKFESLSTYKDSQLLINECKKLETERVYTNALQLLSMKNYEKAQSIFRSLNGYKDSKNKIQDCINGARIRDCHSKCTGIRSKVDSINSIHGLKKSECNDIISSLNPYVGIQEADDLIQYVKDKHDSLLSKAKLSNFFGFFLIVGVFAIPITAIIVMCVAGFGFWVFILDSLPWGLALGVVITLIISFIWNEFEYKDC